MDAADWARAIFLGPAGTAYEAGKLANESSAPPPTAYAPGGPSAYQQSLTDAAKSRVAAAQARLAAAQAATPTAYAPATATSFTPYVADPVMFSTPVVGDDLHAQALAEKQADAAVNAVLDGHYDLDDDNAVEMAGARGADAVRKIVREASKKRPPVPPLKVVPPHEAPPDRTWLDDLLDASSPKYDAAVVLGAVADLFASPGEGGFPLLSRIYKKFKSEEPRARPVRVDTEETYADYCVGRSGPKIDELAAAVAELQEAFDAHVHEGSTAHTTHREVTPHLHRLAAKVAAKREELNGDEVPLSLEPGVREHVRCWRDGDKVCSSIRVCGPDGKCRIVTTCTPIAETVSEVVGYVHDSGADPVDALPVLPTLALMLGCGLPQLARAAESAMERPEVVHGCPFVGAIVSDCDAALAACMALQQQAQFGDTRAQEELSRLANHPEARAVLVKGSALLLSEQGA